jgi:hypothetical protein
MRMRVRNSQVPRRAIPMHFRGRVSMRFTFCDVRELPKSFDAAQKCAVLRVCDAL